jgi:hypothetical protein
MGAPNAQFWSRNVLTGLQPASVQSGGYACGCRWLLEHALRSASDVDVQAHVGTATVRPYAWRVKGWDPRSSQPNLTGWRSVGGPTCLIAA